MNIHVLEETSKSVSNYELVLQQIYSEFVLS